MTTQALYHANLTSMPGKQTTQKHESTYIACMEYISQMYSM